MARLLLALSLVLIFSVPAFPLSFVESVVKEGMGVRPEGMGGAFAAVADDSNAIFYNPGGLGSIQFQYTKGFGDFQSANSTLNDYFLLAYQAVGLGAWRRQSPGKDLINVGVTSVGSTGRSGIGWGFTSKDIQGTVSGEVVNAWSLDLGLKMPLDPRIDFGLVLQDIMKRDLSVPATIRPGIAYKLPVGGVVAVDAEIQNIRSVAGANIYMHYGLERRMTENLVLRAGWGRDRYTAGATAAFKFFTADFALTSHPYAGSAVYLMSFRLGD